MSSVLAHYVSSRPRFSRSANVERDHGIAAIDGYLPTGRILDVIGRIVRGLDDPSAGRTFSLIGPHGGGKSSFAVFLDALLSSPSSDEFKAAERILRSVDKRLQQKLSEGLKSVGAHGMGFTRAFATAEAEPVAATISRSLYAAAVREFGKDQLAVPECFAAGRVVPSHGEIVACVKRLCAEKPLVIVIDEFGKNLEYFAARGGEGDPFLLQSLAEMTQGEGAQPLLILTLQHLSFDDYLQQDSSARRREWAKVQGRFQDIPFTDAPSEARRLIAASLESRSEEFGKAAARWLGRQRKLMESLGFRELIQDARAALPLHPVTLAVLPELCSRYGQNERTLFSFMAGSEPNAVPAYLDNTSWSPGDSLPLVGLDLLYDYFLESSTNMIGVSDGVSRWIEIETRIRDTAGLSSSELKLLKTVGVLNLVSSGGHLRASRSLLEFAVDSSSRSDGSTLEKDLAALIDAGLIVYRAFSDEYRIWRGSDYDLKRVIGAAQKDCELTDLAALLNDAAPVDPVVAGRHSQRTGILRVFKQKFASRTQVFDDPVEPGFDGSVVLLTDESFEGVIDSPTNPGRPVVAVIPKDVLPVRTAAIEAGALIAALRTAENEGADWVARQELIERTSVAQQTLGTLVNETWGRDAQWILLGTNDLLDSQRGPSAVLSEVADRYYCETPRVGNEMIARRELTSQGAKARRELIEAMLVGSGEDAFGITGYGPDRAIYEAVFRSTGMHRKETSGKWSLHPPQDPEWRAAWDCVCGMLDDALESRINLVELATRLAAPPFGLKDGIIPLLLFAVLLHRRDEIALYEHGSLVLAIDDAIAERLTKNPGHFSVRNTQVKNEARKAVIEAIVERFKISGFVDQPTFLNVATALFRELRLLPPYTQKAKRRLSDRTIAVREAFHTAAEPDVLIFEALPHALGMQPFGARRLSRSTEVGDFVNRLAESFVELRDAYPALLSDIQQWIADATRASGELSDLKEQLAAQAKMLEGRVLEPRLRAFIGALTRTSDNRTWLENVAMVIAEGQAPRVWTDDVVGYFPLKVEELGGMLRRTLALLFERQASRSDATFAVSRMTLTRPDGSESVELLAIDEQQRKTVDDLLNPVLEHLAELAGSPASARRMLLARLAIEFGTSEDVNRRANRGGLVENG